jgi:oligopeptide transport system substrate-binding protein
MPGHTAGIALAHDAQRARELLAEAGYPEGRGFPEIEFLMWPRVHYLGLGAQAQWSDTLGVHIRLEVVDWPELLKKRESDERPRLYPFIWAADHPDPDNCLRVGVGLYRVVDKSDYDELVERARRLTDQAERLRLYRQADRILMEEAAVVPIMYEREPMLVKPWVRRFQDWRHTIIDPH